MLIWKWNHHQFLQVTNMYEHHQSLHKTHVVKPSVGYLGNQTNLPININNTHYYEEFPITSRVSSNLGYGNIVEHRVVTMAMTLLLFNTWFWSVERWGLGSTWAGPAQCSVICAPCKVKLDEEKSKHAGLALQNGLGPAFSYSLLRLVCKNTQSSLTPAREECNKYDLTSQLPARDWATIMIGPGGLLLVVFQFFPPFPPHLFAVPVLVLRVRFGITKLGCEKYLCRVTL
jgi:hypothetical protein